MAKEFRPHMDKELFNTLISLYPNQDRELVLNRSVSAFLLLRRVSLKKLKGIFSKEELTGIVAAQNGCFIDFNFGISPKNMLKISMEDSINLEGNDAMYLYDAEMLFTKIEILDDLLSMFLLEECYRFWQNGGELDDFLNEF